MKKRTAIIRVMQNRHNLLKVFVTREFVYGWHKDGRKIHKPLAKYSDFTLVPQGDYAVDVYLRGEYIGATLGQLNNNE